jgi:alpha-ribazole phosphatase
MPLIDLVRHGETERHGLLLGRTDTPLSIAGWRQIERQTEGRGWGAIVCSPLARAREPAERLALDRNLELRIDADWSELDFGAWDGRPLAELEADPVVAVHLDALYRSPEAPAPPEGESWQALAERIARALHRIVRAPAAERALVVTHAGPIRAAVALACDIPFERLWALKIGHGTRVTLRVESEGGLRLWGEIVEIVQP